MKCNSCGCSAIKRRTNYSHGTKSKAIKMLVCKKCGSGSIEQNTDTRRGRWGRR